ncbi:unnamed protein product, partial [Didymodactylos carnosus]
MATTKARGPLRVLVAGGGPG